MNYCLLLLITLQCTFLSATIHPKKELTIIFKEGFIIHLNTTRDFGAIKNCYYKVGNDGHEKEIKLDARDPEKLASGELILPYSKQKCGIRVDNVSYAASTTWVLRAINKDEEVKTDEIKVIVNAPKKDNFETIIKREPGASSIKCINSRNPLIDPSYCKIYNDVQILSNTCESYSIVVRNKTSIKCNTLTWFAFSQTKETILIEPIVKKKEAIKAVINETNDYIIMTCQFPNKVFNCKGEYPDQLTGVFIDDGLMSGRLSTFDTSTANGKCVLEIKKPLKPEEIGIWKIFHTQNSRPTGCLFHIGGEKANLIENAIKRIKPIETIEIINKTSSTTKTQIDLKCKAPFVIDLCYVVDPNNKIHFADAFRFDETRYLGYCEFRLEAIPGEYICGLNGGEAHPTEFTHKYKVIITNDSGEAVTPLVMTDLGQSMQLLCRTPYDIITHCAFIDPKRNVIYTSNFIKSKEGSRYSYYGDGIEQGHCGIKINNIQYNDFGTWRCHIKTTNNKDASFEINVERYGLSEASVIGLGTGLIGAIIILIIGGIYYHRKNRISGQENSEVEEPIQMTSRRRSIDSSESFTSKES